MLQIWKIFWNDVLSIFHIHHGWFGLFKLGKTPLNSL
jgi:hypothetical protein